MNTVEKYCVQCRLFRVCRGAGKVRWEGDVDRDTPSNFSLSLAFFSNGPMIPFRF